MCKGLNKKIVLFCSFNLQLKYETVLYALSFTYVLKIGQVWV